MAEAGGKRKELLFPKEPHFKEELKKKKNDDKLKDSDPSPLPQNKGVMFFSFSLFPLSFFFFLYITHWNPIC